MRKMIIAAASAAMLGATPVLAQNVDVSGGLVDVTVQDVNVLNDSLNENELELLSRNNVAVPVQVQVPIGIAANVCPDVTAAVLAQRLKDGGDVECTATSGSRALGQQILRQKVRGNR